MSTHLDKDGDGVTGLYDGWFLINMAHDYMKGIHEKPTTKLHLW